MLREVRAPELEFLNLCADKVIAHSGPLLPMTAPSTEEERLGQHLPVPNPAGGLPLSFLPDLPRDFLGHF